MKNTALLTLFAPPAPAITASASIQHKVLDRVPPVKPVAQLVIELLAAADVEMSSAEIAEEIGCEAQTVRNIIRPLAVARVVNTETRNRVMYYRIRKAA
jgi:transcription initiation factor IIE alpha subunit